MYRLAVTAWCVVLFGVMVSTGPFPLRALAAGTLFATLCRVVWVPTHGRRAGGRDAATSPAASRTAHSQSYLECRSRHPAGKQRPR